MGILQELHDDLAAVHTPHFLAQMVAYLEGKFDLLEARLETLEGHPEASVPPIDPLEGTGMFGPLPLLPASWCATFLP